MRGGPVLPQAEPIEFEPFSLVIRFQAIQLGGQYGGEDAWLGWANEHLVALLVRLSGPDLPRRRHGWFLEAGYGPCRGEGLFFPTLKAVESWIREAIPPGWPETVVPAADGVLQGTRKPLTQIGS
jgi:hypothetical protein